MLERAASADFCHPDNSPSNSTVGLIATWVKRLALALATFEAIAIAALAISLFTIMHQHTTIFSTSSLLNGSIYLFALYLFTHTTWGFMVLLGAKEDAPKGALRRQKFDGFLDVVS